MHRLKTEHSFDEVTRRLLGTIDAHVPWTGPATSDEAQVVVLRTLEWLALWDVYRVELEHRELLWPERYSKIDDLMPLDTRSSLCEELGFYAVRAARACSDGEHDCDGDMASYLVLLRGYLMMVLADFVASPCEVYFGEGGVRCVRID